MGSLHQLKAPGFFARPDVHPHQKGTGTLLESLVVLGPSCNPLNMSCTRPQQLRDLLVHFSPLAILPTCRGFKVCHLPSFVEDYMAKASFPSVHFHIPTLRRQLDAEIDNAESYILAGGSLSGQKSAEPDQRSSHCTIPGDATGRLFPTCISPAAATIFSA